MEWIVFLVMFWNVENFFTDKPHFRDKCNGIAKTVMLVGDEFGTFPDIIGLAEVDSRQAVQKLLSRTALRKLDYGIVHYDSPDRRGIDCALLYRRSSFRELYSKPCHITDTLGHILPTRDILLVILEPLPAAGSQPLAGVSTPGHGQGDGARRRQVVADHAGNVGRGRSDRRERSPARGWTHRPQPR